MFKKKLEKKVDQLRKAQDMFESGAQGLRDELRLVEWDLMKDPDRGGDTSKLIKDARDIISKAVTRADEAVTAILERLEQAKS